MKPLRGNAVIWASNPSPTNEAILDEIVNRTCNPQVNQPFITIIAIDPELRGDWLAPVPAEYVALKTYGLQSSCIFGYAGNRFFGASLEATWEDFFQRDVRYIVTNDPLQYPSPAHPINQSLTPEIHAEWLDRIRSSDSFKELQPLTIDPGLLVFRRMK